MYFSFLCTIHNQPSMRYYFRLLNILICVVFISDDVFAADDTPKPSLISTKTATPPKIDGKLDDAVWQSAAVASLNVTFLPEYGKVPSRKTEVRVAYDDEAIYFGAMLYDSLPQNINRQLCERDGYSNADNFTAALDTYNDDMNGYRFTVSAAGVQSDSRVSLNVNGDMSWDAVWESAVTIVDNGWICEIKIPYSAIRFPSEPIQDWGMQFNRSINSTGEFILWSPVDPNIPGTVNQWGTYLGLQNITPPLRLSLSPYLNAGYQWDPISDDPVQYEGSPILNGGLDVKYGINESFTLDATLIPNFGEVQSDNVILNLSPFEQQFDERRPFFTEGTEIFNQTFNFISDRLFYSRRIGGQPMMYYDVYNEIGPNDEVIENPGETSLYNATKFSGRTNNNLGIGIFNAVAAEEYAVVRDTTTNDEYTLLTNPMTNYNMVVFEQGLKNNSKVSFTNTNTLRDGAYRDANVSQVLYDLTNKKHNWNAWGFGNVSNVFEPQYNDEGIYSGDDVKTGYSYIVGLSQTTNKWNYNFSHSIVSKNYDHSDMGIQFGDNFTNNFLGFNYNNQEPKKGIFYNYSGWGNVSYNAQVEPYAYQDFSASVGFNGQFKNFWNAGANLYSKPFYYYDFYEPRVEGAKYHHASFAFINTWWGTDYRKDLSFSWNIDYGESPLPKDPYIGFGQFVTWNINDRISIDHSINLSKDHSNYGFVDFYGDDIIFGRRNVTTIVQELSGKLLFGPKMNIIARARHYWGKVVYLQYYALLDNGDLTGTDFTGDYDINFNIFNVDFVYAWEFAPGSYLNIIWKNSIFEYDDRSLDDYFDNLNKTFETPQTNGLSLKLIYYLDYNTLRHKGI